MHAIRLTLRPLHTADAAFILKLVNEPGWLQHIGDRNIHDLDAAAAYIEKGPASSHRLHGFGLDLVCLKDGDEAIGICGLLQRDYLDAPDIGYAFLAAHHRQGYASEALGLVLASMQLPPKTPHLYALTGLDNLGSMRVLEKNGFTFERLMCAPGASSQSRLFRLAVQQP